RPRSPEFARQLSERIAHDPSVDQGHQSIPLRGRNEFGWRHDGAGPAFQAEQELEMTSPGVFLAERQDLLRVETKAVVLQGFLDAMHPAHFIDAPLQFGIAGEIDLYAISALFLGAVAGEVGLPERFLDGDARIGDGGAADTAGNAERAVVPGKAV